MRVRWIRTQYKAQKHSLNTASHHLLSSADSFVSFCSSLLTLILFCLSSLSVSPCFCNVLILGKNLEAGVGEDAELKNTTVSP